MLFERPSRRPPLETGMRTGHPAGARPTPGRQTDGMRDTRQRTTSRALAAVPVAATAALGLGYLTAELLVRAGALAGVDELSQGWLPALPVLLQAVALIWRRRHPLVVLGVVAALDAVVLALTGGELSIGPLAVMVAAFTVARRGLDRAALIVLASAAALSTLVGSAALIASGAYPILVVLGTAAAQILVVYVAPSAVGEYLRSRAELLDSVRERAELAERDRELRAERAVLQDRAAMARDLHDIAAHHVAGIVVSTQAAGSLLTRDPEAARGYIEAARRDAQATLADLRRTVGLLRADEAGRAGDSDEEGSPHGLAGVTDLVEASRARGLDVRVETTGEPRALGPLADTAAYRMVQESLSNAAAHAPGAACSVRVIHSGVAVVIEVESGRGMPGKPGQAPEAWSATGQGGYGLRAMAERARLVGGRLETGPTPAGGWRNHLELPISGVEA